MMRRRDGGPAVAGLLILAATGLLGLGPGESAATGVGEGTSPAFVLYLGPGFRAPAGGGAGEAVSSAFALYLGAFREGHASSPPFPLDTRLPAAFAGLIRAAGSGPPIPGALVELFLGPDRQQATTSAPDGRYAFYATLFGDYVVRASKPGYAMATSDLYRYAGGGTYAVNLDLPSYPTRPMPDLAVGPTDLTYTVLQNGALTLTAMVHNGGGVTAVNTRVRFYDASTGSGVNDYVPITPDRIVAVLGPGQALPVSVTWTPPTGHQRFYVFSDPANAIAESSELNNAGLRDLGALGRVPPRVTQVSARWDGLPDPHLIGTFMTGIPGAINDFTATVDDPDGDVARVRFDFDGTAREDTSPAGGWKVSFDVGSLAPGNHPLTVTAYDRAGLASEPHVVTVVVRDWPAWMPNHLAPLPDFPVSFEIEPGYLNATFRLHNQQSPGDPVLFFIDSVDPDVLIVGSTRMMNNSNVYFIASIPTNPGLRWKLSGKVTIDSEVFNRQVEDREATITTIISPDGNFLDSLSIDFGGGFTIIGFPEIPAGPFFVYGVRIECGLSMDVVGNLAIAASLGQNLTTIDASLAPRFGAQINGVLRVSDPIRFARIELILSPRFLVGPEVRYVYPPGNSSLTGSFAAEVRGRVVGSLAWNLVRRTFLTFMYGPWEWTYPRRAPGVVPFTVTLEPDSVRVPDVFPYPAGASDGLGRVGVVWVADVDPGVPRVDPEAFFSLRDTLGVWGASERITANDRFETIPVLSFLSDGRPLAVWVQSSLLESEASESMTLSTILDRQDLWYAVRGGSGWGAPAPVVEDASPLYRADGLPALCGLRAGGAMLLWARSVGDSALAAGSGEIYFSTFSGATWSAPARLTDDQADDTVPAVCATGGGTALAAWLQEDPPGSGAQRLKWSAWDGNAWGAPQALRDVGWRKQGPSLATAPSGDVLATWVEVETLPDSTLRYHLLASRKPTGQGTWGAVEEIFDDSLFVETPTALVDRRNIAAVTWRGNDGYDGDMKVALKDLDEPGSPWTSPRSVTADSLTDWMATAALDGQNNLHVIDLKSDLSDTTGVAPRGNFFGGLSVVSRGISNDLDLNNELNFGYRPLSADLRLAAGSVWLDEASPTAGDTVLVHARVENIGDVRSAASAVRFYEGHPDSGGVAIGADVALPAVDPDSAATVGTAWVAGAGAYRLYAVADPAGGVPEQNEGNNQAFAAVGVVPDLLLASLAVSEPNPVPGDSVDLTAVVRNDGGATAGAFSLRFARRSGTLATVSGLSVAPADSISVSTRFAAEAGADTLTATADPDSSLPDPERTGNTAILEFLVLPDLSVPADSISYAGTDSAGTLSAVVRNVGGVASPSFRVSFYRGNPLVGGVILDSLRVAGLAAGAGLRVEIPWLAPVGLSTIYVVADAGTEVAERDEGNNESFTDVIRGALADLAVVPSSIVARHEPGGELTLEAAFANIGSAHALGVGVEFFRGDPDAGGVLIADRLLVALDIGDTTIVSVPWAEPDSLDNLVFAVVDRANTIPELSEANNRQSRQFGPITAIGDEEPAAVLPLVLALHPAQPNPFNARTTIRFDLPAGGPVHLGIYDVAGRLVRGLVDEGLSPGFYTIEWDAADGRSHPVASGVYFYRLEAGGKVLTKKLVLLK